MGEQSTIKTHNVCRIVWRLGTRRSRVVDNARSVPQQTAGFSNSSSSDLRSLGFWSDPWYGRLSSLDTRTLTKSRLPSVTLFRKVRLSFPQIRTGVSHKALEAKLRRSLPKRGTS